MALRQEFRLAHSELDDFLFAFVGEEKSGIELTVLSALSRLGMDPRAEAMRLSALPKEAAASALAASIAALPDTNWGASEAMSKALRLITFLPTYRPQPQRSPADERTGHRTPIPEIRKWLVWIALAAAIVVAASQLYGAKDSGPGNVGPAAPYQTGFQATDSPRQDSPADPAAVPKHDETAGDNRGSNTLTTA